MRKREGERENEREREEKEMVTSNDVDGKLNDFSHVKIHRHQTSIEITEKKKNDDEATNASSRYCRVLISKYIYIYVLFNRSFVQLNLFSNLYSYK